MWLTCMVKNLERIRQILDEAVRKENRSVMVQTQLFSCSYHLKSGFYNVYTIDKTESIHNLSFVQYLL